MVPTTRDVTDLFGSLVEAAVASGLVSENEFAKAVGASQSNFQGLARLLVSSGLLTEFQIAALSEGRGDTLRAGNYDLLDRLGAGGMGTVFKARHRRMKRVVALKVLAANLSQNPLFVKRFQREVETIAALGHPNIVMAYDADEAELGHFLVMEFVKGMDLAVCVERGGPLKVEQAVSYLLQAARGLTYAHSQGIIHRDIKPNNLLLDESGNVKITDLGLARLNHGAAGPASGFDVTSPGGAIGTADYMPPEQAIDSTTIDHRADIYSLGCTLHFLLTGKPPFSAPTLVSLLLKHRDAEIPSLRAARPDVPPQLDELFRRMLAKQPDERVQQMADVVHELEALASSPMPGAFQPRQASGISSTVELSPGLVSPGGSTAAVAQQAVRTKPVAEESAAVSVLVVEPSRVLASIIQGYLTEQSLSAAGAAKNGKDAIEAVRKQKPRAVVSAMHLPDMNGVELAQQIRAAYPGEAPGFVLITSETDEESASLSKVQRVLTLAKPFTAEQLADAIRVVTGQSGALAPRVPNEGGHLQKAPSSVTATGEASHPLCDRSRLRVLLVDDSLTARAHMRRVLEGLGFSQFLEVEDGAYAIAVAARENCDLVVTDYNMPLMDGRALVSYLKQNAPTAAIPIFMVTTETDPQKLEPVRKAGVVAIFGKAFPPQEVAPILDRLF